MRGLKVGALDILKDYVTKGYLFASLLGSYFTKSETYRTENMGHAISSFFNPFVQANSSYSTIETVGLRM